MSEITYYGTVETTENCRIAVAIHDPEVPEDTTIHISGRGFNALVNLNPKEVKKLIDTLEGVSDFQAKKLHEQKTIER